MIHLVLFILDLDYEEIFFKVEFGTYLFAIYYLEFIFLSTLPYNVNNLPPPLILLKMVLSCCI